MSYCNDLNIKLEKQNIIKEIKLKGGRITNQRKLIINSLLNFSHPFSTEELYKSITNEVIDLATIYRTLSSLVEMKLLTLIDFQDGVQRYEYISSNKHHHHHIVCKECKSIEPIHICLSNTKLNKLKQLGYTDISHNLEFFAVCKNCQ